MTTDSHPEPSRPVTEIELELDDPTYPFIGATDDGDCVIELAEMVPREGDRFAEFFAITGIRPDRVLDFTASHDTIDVSLVHDFGDGGLFEFTVSGSCPAYTLAKLGALPREGISINGTGRIVAEVPPPHDPAAIVGTFIEENPDAQLVAKREKDHLTPPLPSRPADHLLASALTDRQREVLETAFERGYYEWPRTCTGAEIAEELGITSATFSEHIHAAERKLLTVLFDRQTGR